MAAEEQTGGTALTFDPVWLIRESPRPNLNPDRFLAPGKLVINGHRVEFSPSSAKLTMGSSPQVHLTCDHVLDVNLERHGWGLAPRYAAIRYEKPGGGTAVAYFNDAEWRGWRPLLTASNARMVAAIRRHFGMDP